MIRKISFLTILSILCFSCTEDVDLCSLENWEGLWKGEVTCNGIEGHYYELDIVLNEEFLKQMSNSDNPCSETIMDEIIIQTTPIHGGSTRQIVELNLFQDTLYFSYSFIPRSAAFVPEYGCTIPMIKS